MANPSSTTSVAELAQEKKEKKSKIYWAIGGSVVLLCIVAFFSPSQPQKAGDSQKSSQVCGHGNGLIKLTSEWSEPVAVQTYQGIDWKIVGSGADMFSLRDADRPDSEIILKKGGKKADTTGFTKFQWKILGNVPKDPVYVKYKVY